MLGDGERDDAADSVGRAEADASALVDAVSEIEVEAEVVGDAGSDNVGVCTAEGDTVVTVEGDADAVSYTENDDDRDGSALREASAVAVSADAE